MALEGSLQDMALSDLIQVFRMGPKSGILLLTNDIERGVIYVAEGRMIDALIARGNERSVTATRDEAVIQLLAWEDADFVFRHDSAVCNRPVRIEHDGEWLVLEGMRRRANPSQALPYHKITLDTQLQLSPLPNSAESGVSLDVNQWRILSQIAGCQILRDICKATGVAEDLAIRTVAELMSIGLVEIVPSPLPQPKRSANRSSSSHNHQSVLGHDPVGIDGSSSGDPLNDPQTAPVGRNLLDAIMRRVRGL